MTVCASTHSAEALADALDRAVALLTAGEPVALPTETVYGLAADALRAEAVVRIFEAKERPFFDPLIVHLPDVEWLERVASIPAKSRALVDGLTTRFWPGPLTLVLPRKGIVPDIVTSGLETVAVRMSAHPVFNEIAKRFGKPLAAPSANRFGRISPTTAAHVMSELDGRIKLVVDGGPAAHGVESTIVAVEGDALRILRSGPVSSEQLAEFGRICRFEKGHKLEAPGQLESHYAPRTPLKLQLPGAVSGEAATGDVGLLAWSGVAEPHKFACVEILSPTADLREAAATLFSKMRRLDEAGVRLIVAEPVPERGLGVAIMDRLRRAAHSTAL
ncbi:MAG: Threonylcarbamoyl-AMP synthase [Chthoniobacteraceae bacterium]|nr:Threonylcarbamoyl-AMP synthase [Chthoniobacteraceae bacterium]